MKVIRTFCNEMKKRYTRFVGHCKVLIGISVEKSRSLVIVFSNILVEIYDNYRDILFLAGYTYLVLFYSVVLIKVLTIIYGLTQALIDFIYIKFHDGPMYLYKRDLVNVVIVMLGLTKPIFRFSQIFSEFLYSRGVDIDPLDLFIVLYLLTTVFIVVLFAK